MLKRANIVNIVYVILSSPDLHAMPIPSHPHKGARQAFQNGLTTADHPGKRHAAPALRPLFAREEAAPLFAQPTNDLTTR